MNDTQLEADHPVDTTSQQSVESPQDTTGTKIGAVSDFEQDLIESEVIDSPTDRQTEAPSDDGLADG